MSDLVRNPEDWFSHNEAHINISVPLKSIDVEIKIIGFVARVTSSLQYTNSEDKPIEAEFTFPVDDGSAVFKFEAEIEGRHIVAEIQEKEQVGHVCLLMMVWCVFIFLFNF